MYHLILSVLSSAFIIILFNLIGKKRIDTLSTIIINYPVACLTGFFLTENFQFSHISNGTHWLPVAAFLGVLFIVMFWLLGTSTQRVGVSFTTVAAKMSMIIPISYSLWIDPSDSLTLVKALGIVLAVVAVIMSVLRTENQKVNIRLALLPIVVFLGLGTLDAIVKFAQMNLLNPSNIPLFTGAAFGFAFIAGLLVLPFSKRVRSNILLLKTWAYGIPLGLLNFGSMYFLIRALTHVGFYRDTPIDSSILFGVNNMGIVAVNVIIGFFFFHEKPSKLNWGGMFLSVVAMAVLILT